MGPRFSAALTFASEIHGSQLRKGTSIPYVAHLLDALQRGRDGTLWCYRTLTDAFRGRTPVALWRALDEAVSELESRLSRL